MSQYELPITAHAQTLESIPIHTRTTLNPDAKEFIPKTKRMATLTDILREGEIICISVRIGYYDDGYPILCVLMARYENGVIHVTDCEDVPSMVGRSAETPGPLLFDFIRELRRAKKLRHNLTPSVWKNCHVKRNGSHISFRRLATEFLSSSSTS